MDQDDIITKLRAALVAAAPANANTPLTRVHHSGEIAIRLITEAPEPPPPRRRKPAPPLPRQRATDHPKTPQGPSHPLSGDHLEAYDEDVLPCPPSWQRRDKPEV